MSYECATMSFLKLTGAFLLFFATAYHQSEISAAEADATKSETTMPFVVGGWNPQEWTAVRMPNQEKPVPLVQKPLSIGTTTESFNKADYGKERDNALLLYD